MLHRLQGKSPKIFWELWQAGEPPCEIKLDLVGEHEPPTSCRAGAGSGRFCAPAAMPSTKVATFFHHQVGSARYCSDTPESSGCRYPHRQDRACCSEPAALAAGLVRGLAPAALIRHPTRKFKRDHGTPNPAISHTLDTATHKHSMLHRCASFSPLHRGRFGPSA